MDILKIIRLFTTRYYLKGFYRVLWLLREWLKRENKIYEVQENLVMKLDYNHYYQWMIASTNYYSRGVKYAIKKVLRPGDLFIDVGANIGYTGLFARSIIGKDGMIIGFEPDPIAVDVFRKNMELNKIKNFRLIEKVCSNANGSAVFNIASQLGWSTAVANVGSLEIKEKINVPQCILDSVVKELLPQKSIKLIKVDVEGFEPLVLEGSTNIIKQNETSFIIEVNNARLNSNGFFLNDIVKHFDRYCYKFYWIKEDRNILKKVTNIDFIKIDKFSNYYGKDGDIFILPISNCSFNKF